MTKLMEWLCALAVFLAIHLALVTRQIKSPLVDEYMFEIKLLPIVLILLFGLYAATTVLYRTFTFNDCVEASKELQEQIVEAREDLKQKGFVF